MSVLFDCKVEDHKRCLRFYYSGSEIDPRTGFRRLKECECSCHDVQEADPPGDKSIKSTTT